MFVHGWWGQKNEKQRLDSAKEELLSVKYHPLRDYASSSARNHESNKKKKKTKNWKDIPLDKDSSSSSLFV